MVMPGDFTKGAAGLNHSGTGAGSFGSQFANSLMQPFTTDDSYYSTYNSWKAATVPTAAAAAATNFAKGFPWGLGTTGAATAAAFGSHGKKKQFKYFRLIYCAFHTSLVVNCG